MLTTPAQDYPEPFTTNGMEVSLEDPHEIDQPDDTLLMSSQPPRGMGQTLADYPDGWAECLLTAHAKRQIVETPGFPASLYRPGKTMFRISTTPNKGLAMFALRNISAGDIIHDERPLLIVPTKGTPPPDSGFGTKMTYYESMLHILVDRMAEESRTAFLALHNSHTNKKSGPLYSLVRTNGFTLYGLTDKLVKKKTGTYSGVFKELSRINHSCSPNAGRSFVHHSLSMRLCAARNISAGEEITITYTGLLTPTVDRQKALAPYGIMCDCRACLKPKRTDKLRKSFKKTHTISPRPGFNLSVPSDKSWLEPALETVRTMEREGVQCTHIYMLAVRPVYNACVFLGDEVNMQIFGRKLITSLLINGLEGEANGVRMALGKPSAVENWGRIYKATLDGIPLTLTFS